MIHDLRPYPEYKDSGSPWLGDVPGHWAVRSLGSLTSAIGLRGRPDLPLLSVVREKGVILRSAMRDDENHNYIPDDLSGYKVVRAGNLVINKMKAWQGSLGIAPTDGVVSPAYFVFDFEIGCRRFGQGLLRSKTYVAFFARVSDGVRIGQWDLSIDGMKRIPVVIPPLSEQAGIARFIDYADRRIRRYIGAKKKLVALLNEQKQAIIHRAVTRGLDSNARLKPSGLAWLGDVPEHWKRLRLKDLSPRISGRLVYQPAQYFSEEGVPFLMGNNVTPEGIRWSGVKRIPQEVNDRFAHHALREGDVITVRVGAPGVTCVVPKEADGFNCGSLMIIRRAARFDSRWLAYVMNSRVVRDQIALVQYGAAQEQINIEDATNFVLPVPPLEEQVRISGMLSLSTEPFERAVESAARSIVSTREYRTRLIADVVTGKLDVREAAARLPDEADDSEPLDEADALAEGDDADPDATPEEPEG